MKIFLTGLPGSGKSTIGRKLAALMHWQFLDTDDEIIRIEKRSIETIFIKEGEPYFRQKEREILNQVLQLEDAVISTGGGTPCFFDNMEMINNHGTSIFLNIPVASIAARLKKGKNKNRPMVAGKSDNDLLDFLSAKHKERYPFYSKAHLEINSAEISAEALLEALKEKGLV